MTDVIVVKQGESFITMKTQGYPYVKSVIAL